MRAIAILCCLLFSAASSFDVASVKRSAQTVGPDRGNQMEVSATSFSAHNTTLKRLIVEAYNLQPHQVTGGPKWLDSIEYDIEAKTESPTNKEQMLLKLQSLLTSRFGFTFHNETKELSVYELLVDNGGAKLTSSDDPNTPVTFPHFRGTMRQLANLIAAQLTIPVLQDPTRPAMAGGNATPVLDKTSLSGIYDITVENAPEPGADMFTVWQRFLKTKLGLKLESRKAPVQLFVVDHAEIQPSAN